MLAQKLIIQHNKFKHYYRGGIYCKNIAEGYILYNECSDGNLRHDNDGAIVYKKGRGHIAYNKLTNYGYMGIGVGVWYGEALNSESLPIIVKYNELYMTPDYRNSFSCVPLLDGGAIYTWTRHNLTIIRYNFVNGHSGAMDNRGIFCDDGTYNVWLYGNLVINTRNSYAIDLRQVNNLLNNCNTNNIILFNIFDGYYRFEGTESQSLSDTNTKGCNIILGEHRPSLQYNKIDYINAARMENDWTATGCKVEEQCLALPASMKNWLSATNLPEFILSHIRYGFF